MAKDTLTAWLRDAHAMEKSTVDNMERLVKHVEDDPQLKKGFERHLEESRRQIERLETCLGELGADPSAAKDAVTRMAGIAQAYASGAAKDEPVKNCLAAYAFEHFEIASYTSLIAAADRLGEAAVKRACEENLREERAMADWLETEIPRVTERFLASG